MISNVPAKTLAVLSLLLFGFAPAGAQPDLSVFPYARLAGAQNSFALKFFRRIYAENPRGNLLVSPYSLSAALGMVYNGAAGTTREAMARAMGLENIPREEVNIENGELNQALKDADPKVQMDIANSLWGNKQVAFKTDFLGSNKTYYQARVESLDFGDPRTPDKVNQWVSDQTRGKIRNILGPLSPTDVLVLVNAVYFKGLWAHPFKKEATAPAPFRLDAKNAPDRSFMHGTETFPYLETPDFQAVRLPYGSSGRLSLMVFLPKEGKGLDGFCRLLTDGNWKAWTSPWSQRKVVLSLPKFEMDYSTSLMPSLKGLGMGILFGKGADFGSMADLPLYVSEAVQKTYMKVDEEGTEAAAATEFRIGALAMAPETRPPVVMTVDRPFFLALVDENTRSVLFAGAIRDPQTRN
jgi:serpin B